jgi:hypothetical protein
LHAGASVKALVSARPDTRRKGREIEVDIAALVRLAHASEQVNCGPMRTRSRKLIEIGTVLLLVAPGCKAEQPAKSDDKAKSEPAKDVAKETPPPETDTAAPMEPPPPPEPQLAGPSAGDGFELGAKLEANAGEISIAENQPLSHAGATVSVSPHVVQPEPEGDQTLHIQVRVEFEGVEAERGLNHSRVMPGSYCDELTPEVKELAKLEDGRWLIDAQLACSGGEDYMSTDNAHTVIAVDGKARSAVVLWTGADTVTSAMGVCVSESVNNFEISGAELIIRKTEVTELDEEAAKELPDAAEDCVAKAATTTEVARIKLAPSK